MQPMKAKIFTGGLFQKKHSTMSDIENLASIDLTECENIYSTNISKNFQSFRHGRQANIFLINPTVMLRLAKKSSTLAYSF